MLMSQREAIAQMAGEILVLADGSPLSDAEVGVLVTFLNGSHGSDAGPTSGIGGRAPQVAAR